jgi:eukaryotic-like serine/threonine-protein kinase
MYDYDRTPLEARVVKRDTTHADWIRETVSIAAAYGGERLKIDLFVPRKHRGPFQTVVVFPGSNAIYEAGLDALDTELLGFLVRGGRVLAYPEYKGMYSRRDQPGYNVPRGSVAYRDLILAQGKDLQRAIDYLETRPDVDTSRIGFIGISLGGVMGGLVLGIEDRLSAAVLYVAGLVFQRARPEADPINFLPRVGVPVLMLNGRYDDGFPYETSQRPMFEMLGTPREHKRLILFEDGHYLPRAQMISETLGWYDRYLGPVGR